MLHAHAIFLGPLVGFLVRVACPPLLTWGPPALTPAANVAPAQRLGRFFLRCLLLPSAAGVHIEHTDVAASKQLQRVLDLFGLVKLGRACRPETFEPGRKHA